MKTSIYWFPAKQYGNMKKNCIWVIALLVWLQFFVSLSFAESQFSMTLNIIFKPNIIFSRYGVDLYINDQLIKSLPHGTDYSNTFLVEKGNCDIVFYKSDNKQVYGKFSVDVNDNVLVSCKISCHMGEISIDDLAIESIEPPAEAVQTPLPVATPSPAESTDVPAEAVQTPLPVATPSPAESTDKPVTIVPGLGQSLSTETFSSLEVWTLSYNRLGEFSELLSVQNKSGEDIKIIGHNLPAGKYHVVNSHNLPARLSFYKKNPDAENTDFALVPSGQKDIILFKNEEAFFALRSNEFIRLSDGSIDLLFELMEK